ncbi:hypothetical protein V1511DRAFT_491542 [Dipodascopsis uninucleata]
MLSDVTELAKWVVENGGFCSADIEFREDQCGGTTAFAVSDISAGKQKILQCPLDLIIDYRKSAEDLFGSLVACPFKEKPEIAVRLFLCSQKLQGQNAKWYNYIKSLPESFDTPLYYGDDEFQLLRGTNIYSDASHRKTAWEEEWKDSLNMLGPRFDKPRFTWELYLWACTVLTSRSFPSKLIDKNPLSKECPILVPLIDTLNHYPRTSVEWHVDEHGFSLLEGPLTSGSEVMNNYGPKGNEELLMGYGFCIKNNEFDSVALRIRDLRQGRGEYAIYYLHKHDPLPEQLIKMFERQVMNAMEINSNDVTLRCRLDSLEKLTNAISLKKTQIGNYRSIDFNGVKDDSRRCRRVQHAVEYVNSQISILTAAICRSSYLMCVALSKVTTSEQPDSGNIKELRSSMYRLLRSRAFSLRETLESHTAFRELIKKGFGTCDSDILKEYGFDDQALIFFISYLRLNVDSLDKRHHDWICEMKDKYDNEDQLDNEYIEDFETIREDLDEELFPPDRWSARILAWASKIVDCEGLVIASPDSESTPEYWVIMSNI